MLGDVYYFSLRICESCFCLFLLPLIIPYIIFLYFVTRFVYLADNLSSLAPCQNLSIFAA